MNREECCAFLHVHEAQVAHVRDGMPGEGELNSLTELFRVLGDGTRTRILYALHTGELCVCDLAALLSMSVSAISHQLRILRTARLVATRREGKTVFYRLDDAHVHTLLGQGLAHVSE